MLTKAMTSFYHSKCHRPSFEKSRILQRLSSVTFHAFPESTAPCFLRVSPALARGPCCLFHGILGPSGFLRASSTRRIELRSNQDGLSRNCGRLHASQTAWGRVQAGKHTDALGGFLHQPASFLFHRRALRTAIWGTRPTCEKEGSALARRSWPDHRSCPSATISGSGHYISRALEISGRIHARCRSTSLSPA